MRKSVRTAILVSLCGSVGAGLVPSDVLAGPMSVAPPSTVSLNAPTTEVHYYRPHHWRHYRHWGYYHRRHRWGYYRPHYYRRYSYPYYGYRYDPAGALFASAALGLVGAGIARRDGAPLGLGMGMGPGLGLVVTPSLKPRRRDQRTPSRIM